MDTLIKILSTVISAEISGTAITFAKNSPESGFLIEFSKNRSHRAEWSISAIAVEWDIYLDKKILLGNEGSDYDISCLFDSERPKYLENFKLNPKGQIQLLISGGYYIRISPATSSDDTNWVISRFGYWLLAWDRLKGLVVETLSKDG